MVTLISSVVLILSLHFSSIALHASDLRIMAEEYPPYSFRVDGKAEGLIVDLVELIYEDLHGEMPQIRFYPWARGYRKLQHGTGDVLFPMAMTPERSTEFKFVGPLLWDDVYFYRRKNSDIRLDCVDDARKVSKIAVTRDDIFHQNLIKLGYSNLDISPTQKCDFLKLLKGRVDLVPMGSKAYRYFMEKFPELNTDDYERTGPPVFFTATYIAFSKATPDEIIVSWQGALNRLKAEGRWLELVDKYFPPER